MGISFAQPLALWGLLGLPVILAIHFLQSRNRRVRASTLFLLDRLPEETRRGAVFTRIRNGWQLWLQLLAVLLLTLLLARPMRLREESFQSIALVLDTSASMRAFRDRALEEADRLIRDLGSTAGTTEWWILPSNAEGARLFQGIDARAARDALNQFDPWMGAHPVRNQLQRARTLVGEQGLVIYLTDHPPEESLAGVWVRSVGEAIANAGFAGIQFESKANQGFPTWEVAVINTGSTVSERTVEIRQGDSVVESDDLEIQPGGMARVLGGGVKGDKDPFAEPHLPGKLPKLRFSSSDAFPPDDELPYVIPRPKKLMWKIRSCPPGTEQWIGRITRTVPGTLGIMDIFVWTHLPADVDAQSLTGEIRFVAGEGSAPYTRVVPGDHPLVEELSWEGLLVEPFRNFPMASGDEVLLWMGDFPLVVLRQPNGVPLLLLNFDPSVGNAKQDASLVLLLHRFIKQVRDAQPLTEQSNFADNFQTRQAVADVVPGSTVRFTDLDGNERVWVAGVDFRMPDRPGWLTAEKDGKVYFRAGVQFGDLEEGDFRKAGPVDLPGDLVLEQRKRNSESDFLLPVWFSLLALILFGSWWVGAERRRTV